MVIVSSELPWSKPTVPKPSAADALAARVCAEGGRIQADRDVFSASLAVPGRLPPGQKVVKLPKG